jgi:hypothetical protein
MLLLSDLPPEAPIPVGTGFPDHAEPRRIHWLPAGLRLLREADGSHRFTLARWRDATSGGAGGMLHVELGADAPDEALKAAAAADGWVLQPVGFHAARMRLEGWAGMLSAGAPLGPWQPGNPTAEVLAAESYTLTPEATQVLDAVLNGTEGSLSVTVEAEYSGLGPSLPVLVTASPAILREVLQPLLPAAAEPAGAPEDAVRAAILSLPEGGALLDIQPLAEGAPPSRAAILNALASHLLGVLLAPAPGDPWAMRRYRWAEDGPEKVRQSWDLSVRLPQRARWQATWSAAGFLGTLAEEERQRYVQALPLVQPFAPVPVLVLAALPLDARFIRSLQVDVTTTGVTGLPQKRSFHFPAAATTVRFIAFYPAMTSAFSLTATVTATLAPAPDVTPAWPVVLPSRPLPVVGTLVEVTAAAVGLGIPQISVEPAAFEKAASFEAVIRHGNTVLAAATLTRAEPTAAPAFALTDALATLTVTARQGTATCVLHEGPADAVLTIRAEMLEVLAPDAVTIVLDPDCIARTAFAAITLSDPSGRKRSFTLDADEGVVWPCWRASVFEPVSFRYQLQYVARRSDGSTAPLAIGAWQDGQGTRLAVAPPSAEDQV